MLKCNENVAFIHFKTEEVCVSPAGKLITYSTIL